MDIVYLIFVLLVLLFLVDVWVINSVFCSDSFVSCKFGWLLLILFLFVFGLVFWGWIGFCGLCLVILLEYSK